MARALDHRPKKYDEAKLAAMASPFNVRVEKIRGNTRSPIPLPEAEDNQPGGTGWDIDTVRQLESWLVTEWSGGGLYEITVTDSSPTPQVMTWQPFFDPKTYPEKTPPPLAEASTQPLPPPLPPQIPQAPSTQFSLRGSPMPFPNGLPQGHYPQSQYPQQQHQQPYYQPPPMPNPPMPGSYQWDAYQREVERREKENREREIAAELKRERQEKEQMQREAVAAQHAAALERERQANAAALAAQAAQVAELRNMITGLASAIKETAKPAGPSPEVEALRLQLEAAKQQADRERAEREHDRRERETKEMIARMEQNQREQMAEMRRTVEAQQAQHAAAMAAMNANKGPDQFLVMMQNQHREQVELAKEQSRNQLAQMQALQTYMMNPRDMMTMAKEQATATDHAIERSTNFFGKVIETQQKVTENLLQMQPGSNGVVELVGSGIDRVGSLAERYLGGKQLEAQLTHQGQVQVAEAQARAYAQTVIAEQQRQAAAAAPEQAANTQSAGLGNPQPAQAAPAQPQPKKAKPQTKTKSKADATPAPAGSEIKRLGKTDKEWFGPIMPQVAELRTNANKFIESIRDNKLDKHGNPAGWAPAHAAQIVVQAVGVVVGKQIEVPILMDLLFQDRFADFVDVLVPDPIVTQQYRDELAQEIIRLARLASGLPPDGEHQDMSQGEGSDDDDVDDDDADDDQAEASSDDENPDAEPNSDDAADGAVMAPVVPIVQPRKPGNSSAAPRRT